MTTRPLAARQADTEAALKTLTLNPATPWGESYDDLADAILADKDAPPVLLFAAFLHRHGSGESLRSMIADAVALGEQEKKLAEDLGLRDGSSVAFDTEPLL